MIAVGGCFQDFDSDSRDLPYKCREGGETAADDAACYFGNAVVFIKFCISALIVFAVGRTLLVV